MSLLVNKQTFEDKISKSKNPVLVDFFADWCTPCKIMAPILEEIANEYKNEVTVLKINIDENPDISQKYDIMSVPTIIMFKDGIPKKTSVGIAAKEKIIEMIKN